MKRAGGSSHTLLQTFLRLRNVSQNTLELIIADESFAICKTWQFVKPGDLSQTIYLIRNRETNSRPWRDCDRIHLLGSDGERSKIANKL
jgi:hypothetical protein